MVFLDPHLNAQSLQHVSQVAGPTVEHHVTSPRGQPGEERSGMGNGKGVNTLYLSLTTLGHATWLERVCAGERGID